MAKDTPGSIPNQDDPAVSDDITKATVPDQHIAGRDKPGTDEPGKPGAGDQPPPDPRMAIYQKFDANRETIMAAKELGDPADAGEGDGGNEGEGGEDDQNADPSSDAGQPELVKVKINGEVRDVEKAKVDAAGGIAIYQKEVSANERLKRASETEKLLEEKAAEVRAAEEAWNRKQQEQQHQVQESNNNKALTDAAKKYREALMDGDEEAADTMMVTLIDQARKTSATDKEIVDQIGKTAAEQVLKTIARQDYVKNVKEAQKMFDRDYADISQDQHLRNMADSFTVDIQKESPDWTPQEIVKEAADRTRKWLDAKGVKPPTTPNQGNDGNPNPGDQPGKTVIDPSRRTDKQQLSTPRTPTGRAPAAPTAPATETNKEYIARIRRERGLDPA